MLLKKYRIELINESHLAAIRSPDWHMNIVAKTPEQAWGKFVSQRKAPVCEGADGDNYCPLPNDYNITFIRAVIV